MRSHSICPVIAQLPVSENRTLVRDVEIVPSWMTIMTRTMWCTAMRRTR